MPKIVYPRKCEQCNRIYRSRQSFSLHKEACMGLKRVCNNCQRTYSSKNTFLKHIKICQEESKGHAECPEPDCNATFYHKTILIKHLEEDHLKYSKSVDIHFNNLEEFLAWKDEESILCNSFFTKVCGSKTQVKKHYFACQFHHYRESGNIPNTKCLSRIIVDYTDDNKVIATYYPIHNHAHFNFNGYGYPPEECTRSFIQQCLALGASPREILKHIKTVIEDEAEENTPRDSFNGSNYIRNLKKKRKCSSLHPSDTSSLSIVVNELSKEEFNPIFIFKPQGGNVLIGPTELDNLEFGTEVFAIALQTERQLEQLLVGLNDVVCIDVTRGTNRYDFPLVSLIVPDNFGKGYPVCHFICSHLDVPVLDIFFKEIKSRLGSHNIKVILSVEDDVIFTSVQNVFGEVPHLVCTWHLLSSWKRQFIDEIRDRETQVQLFESLYNILHEQDLNNFKLQLKDFILTYRYKAANFISTFIAIYLNKPKMWASCYQPCSHRDTTILCEPFYNKLKSYFSDKRPTRRISDLIKNLVEIENDFFFQNLFKKVIHREESEKTREVDKNHDEGMKIPSSLVKYEADNNSWHVQSQSKEGTYYTVIKINDFCPTPDHCFFNCKDSCTDLCQHIYQCSCSAKTGLCKHIHKVYQLKEQQLKSFGLECLIEINEDESQPESTPATLPEEQINIDERVNTDGKLMLEEIAEVYETLPTSTLIEINPLIKNVYDICFNEGVRVELVPAISPSVI